MRLGHSRPVIKLALSFYQYQQNLVLSFIMAAAATGSDGQSFPSMTAISVDAWCVFANQY
jgi:hypothetical protein